MKQRTQLLRDIEKAKARLINKAKRKGLWENFGQDEVRQLKDKHDYYALIYGDKDERLLGDQIQDFDEWCMNFNDADLRQAKRTTQL